VMRDAYISQAQYLDSYIWSDFLDERSQRDPDICEWKESSKKKMGQVVFRMLAEAGYLKSTRKLELQRVIVRAELRSAGFHAPSVNHQSGHCHNEIVLTWPISYEA
jgi:hypothetical protein